MFLNFMKIMKIMKTKKVLRFKKNLVAERLIT